MITGIIYFILLSTNTLSYISVSNAVCNLNIPSRKITDSPFDKSVNPGYYYASDPVHADKFCRVNIINFVNGLNDGTYVAFAMSSQNSGKAFSLVGLGQHELIIRDRSVP